MVTYVPFPREIANAKLCELLASLAEKCTLLTTKNLKTSAIEIVSTVINGEISKAFPCPVIQKVNFIIFRCNNVTF